MTGQHLADLTGGVLAAEAQAHQLTGGQAAGPLGGEGAVAVQGVLGIHHAAVDVGADGAAAAHVADDKVQVLILPAVLLGIALGNGLLVQGVEDAGAMEQGMAGIAGHVGQLVHHHGVHNVGGDAQLVADLPGQQTAQVGGMLPLNAHGAVADQPVADGVGAAADGGQQTAPAGNGGQGRNVEALVIQGLHHQLAPPVLLGGDGIKFVDLLGAVAQRLVEKQGFVLIDADLGGRGARVDDQNSVRHGNLLLLH